MNVRLSRTTLAVAIYFLLHLATQLSARFFEVAPGISIWYPPCGLALALMVIWGPRMAPVVFVTNAVVAWITGEPSPWWVNVVYPALITLNYAGAAIVARRYLGQTLLPGTRRETLVFALVIILAPATMALLGTAVSVQANFVAPERFWRAVTEWWVGDVSGLLTVVPVAMVFARPLLNLADRAALRPRPHAAMIGSIALHAGVLVACVWIVFALQPLPKYHAFYLCFLPLIWTCLRFGLPGATLATLVITMGSLIGMRLTGSSIELIVSFLLFELTVAVVGLGLGSAVSRRNEVETQLAANEARFDRVIAGAQLGLWDWDVARHRVSYNRRYAEMLGRQLEEIEPASGSLDHLVHPADRDRVAGSLRAHLEGRTDLHDVEYRVLGADRKWRWLQSRGSIVARDAVGHPLLVSGTHVDITDRKRAESEAHRLLQIIDATPDYVLTADLAGQLIYLNASFLRLLDRPSVAALRGCRLGEIFPEQTVRTIEHAVIPGVRETGVWHGEIALRDAKGREIPASLVALIHRDDENIAPTLSFVMRDISRQKQAEAETIENERKMLLVQKSESLGVLAGGIAHDFNNLLTAVMGNTSLARLDLPPGSPVHDSLGQIEIAARRAADLCQQMLAYAGRSPLTFTEVDISELIEETQQLLQVSIGRKIEVVLDLAHPLAEVLAAPAQMQQVFMNLALNASEAIGDRGGRVVIRTRTRSYDLAELRRLFPTATLAAGTYVLVEVEDTGSGMTPEVQARIFEPFFTTKFTGHGLGLAAVMGIVRSHGGAIHVASEVGRGSIFSLVFPSIQRRVVPAAEIPADVVEWKGTGLALVVDDETSVRTLVARILEGLGFTTVVAVDGVEGVEQFRQHADQLRVVFLDLTMPRMDGEEAFRQMNQIRADIPVILMSGFSEKLTLERFAATKPAGFLPKPFDLKTLQARLQALDPDAAQRSS